MKVWLVLLVFVLVSLLVGCWHFQISVINNGRNDLERVVIKNILPQKWEYIRGSTKLYYYKQDPAHRGEIQKDGICTGGLKINIPNGTSEMRELVFSARAPQAVDLPIGVSDFTNSVLVQKNNRLIGAESIPIRVICSP